jgi:hypothetical protein
MGIELYIYAALFGVLLGAIALPWRYKMLGTHEHAHNSLLFHFFLWATMWPILLVAGIYASLVAYRDAWIGYLKEQDRRNMRRR